MIAGRTSRGGLPWLYACVGPMPAWVHGKASGAYSPASILTRRKTKKHGEPRRKFITRFARSAFMWRTGPGCCRGAQGLPVLMPLHVRLFLQLRLRHDQGKSLLGQAELPKSRPCRETRRISCPDVLGPKRQDQSCKAGQAAMASWQTPWPRAAISLLIYNNTAFHPPLPTSRRRRSQSTNSVALHGSPSSSVLKNHCLMPHRPRRVVSSNTRVPTA